MFEHESSASGFGRTTARSQIRSLMRSRDAASYIDRKRCIQHDSVFVAFSNSEVRIASRPCSHHGDRSCLFSITDVIEWALSPRAQAAYPQSWKVQERHTT